MIKIIGVTGFKRAGKGEVGNAILSVANDRALNARAVGFADKLKVAAARALGLKLSWADSIAYMDEFKERGWIDFGLTTVDATKITGRQYLQWFGTEVGRDTFGGDFWIDQVLINPANIDERDWSQNDNVLEYVEEQYPGLDILAITDVRFDNEAQRVLDCGGEVWEVQRDGTGGDGHVSEKGVDPRLITRDIENNGTLMDLRYEVEKALGV